MAFSAPAAGATTMSTPELFAPALTLTKLAVLKSEGDEPLGAAEEADGLESGAVGEVNELLVRPRPAHPSRMRNPRQIREHHSSRTSLPPNHERCCCSATPLYRK